MCRRRFELRTPILKGWCSSCWTNGTERGDGITMATIKPRKLLVPLTGLEPVRILLRGILSPLCLPIPPQRLFNFYKYYNIFYRNCQDFYWLGGLDSNQRNDGVKVRCLTPWLHPILYKYYIIFLWKSQDIYFQLFQSYPVLHFFYRIYFQSPLILYHILGFLSTFKQLQPITNRYQRTPRGGVVYRSPTCRRTDKP